MQSIADPTENHSDTLTVAARLVGAMSQHLEQVAVEVASMSFDEFERGAELVDGLAQARTLDHVVKVETDYLLCAQRAFSQRAQRLSDLYIAIGRDMTKSVGETRAIG